MGLLSRSDGFGFCKRDSVVRQALLIGVGNGVVVGDGGGDDSNGRAETESVEVKMAGQEGRLRKHPSDQIRER